MIFSIYVVDDEQVAREGISLALKKHYSVKDFPTAEDALKAMQDDNPDLVLLDIGLPGMSGLEALEEIKKRRPDCIVIMITAYEDVKTVVSAMKLGAHDYVVKPLQMPALMINVGKALETLTMRKEIRELHERWLKENLPCFVGESNAIQDIMDIVKKVAQSPDTSILIQGETGTGKELIARAIHYRSPNFKEPMVSVNCAAIPKDLIESELFGYEKGAFSGADASGKPGLVENAANGSLFLDEVGDLGPEAQAKILRFLESGEYYRVGGTKKRTVKTRVISATNKDLLSLIETGEFRRDLYYRLTVVKLEVPSLNQRRDDILPIARHFLVEFNQKLGKSVEIIPLETEAALVEHHWTGNVRELKNLVERGVLLADGSTLTVKSLGLDNSGPGYPGGEQSGDSLPGLTESGINLPDILSAVEKDYFDKALAFAGGNESRAAQLLGMSRDAFRYRRKKK